jgi:hypothetical protein
MLPFHRIKMSHVSVTDFCFAILAPGSLLKSIDARVQPGATDAGKRRQHRPRSAERRENRPRFTGVGSNRPASCSASGASPRKGVEVRILSSAPAFARACRFPKRELRLGKPREGSRRSGVAAKADFRTQPSLALAAFRSASFGLASHAKAVPPKRRSREGGLPNAAFAHALFSRIVTLSSSTNGPDRLLAYATTPTSTIVAIRHHARLAGGRA